MNLTNWMNQNWGTLKRGKWIPLPLALPHPASMGFHQPALAEPNGQIRDWVKPLDDGSRLHLHEHDNGVFVAHRDATDPERGPLQAISHLLFESKTGAFALVTLGLLALKKAGQR